ncbi:uncharacterized protein LOC111682808 [Lucilia cuprina]|uniref:uncharacterized protein LOC111682808 n=1 Tax=Lucilia cuprina TaxID=7375 RepID=UPI001F069017|nr:uncharacterized protein LOC111682808 [Lucilia cuprina]XP_046808577.1 uncharacterized protein LOC111682808 [Lucilia cuprina]
MAASIYATPPPDLSSEDTALSDVSNTSSTTNANATTAATATLKQLTNNNTNNNICEETSTAITSTTSSTLSTSNNNNNNKQKRTISDVLKDTSTSSSSSSSSKTPINNISNTTQCSSKLPTMGSSTNAIAHDNGDDDNEAANTMAAVAAAANAAMQLQLLEAINDAAKKRRKQHNPSRMDEESNNANNSNTSAPTVDFEDKLSKMFLPKSMEQFKETFELLQQQQHIENISKTQELNDHKMVDHQQQQQQQHQQAYSNPYHTFCKECGENFENEFKLSLHMMQEHNENSEGYANHQGTTGDMTPLDILASVKVKLERPECESPSSNHNSDLGSNTHDQSQQHNNANSAGLLTNGKELQQQQQQWMGGPAMAPMGFPFPPEAAAAAALQAGGYLPLLGVPGFPGVDGLNRPPLRIFNPEAFCELCNKEFCNKYFLKTHKANKHGIYDPSSDGLSSSQQQQQNASMNAMNQMFQLQMQQQHQHLQQQQQQMQMELAQQKLMNEQQRKDSEASSTLNSPTTKATSSNSQQQSNTQVTPPAPAPVFCDICSKRFTNVFAMRRHRAKAHEQNSNSNSQRNSPSEGSSNSLEATTPSTQTPEIATGKQFQMPEGFRQDFVLEQEEVSFTPQPRKLSPQSQQQAREANFAHDKLKRLGVLNPEAFCEICCKEYCNKYFLRTHKWKRHGIFMPPEEADNPQKLPTWPFMNMPGMPVNLMMAQRMMSGGAEATVTEELPQQSSKRIKLEQPDEDEGLKDSNNDENQENRSENNQVLSVPSTPEPSKLMADSQTMAQSPEAAMGLQNLQKLQTMIQQLNDLNGKRPIACHLCGREMENQYALQAHIMAEHAGGMEGAMPPLNFPSQLLMQQQALLKQSPNGSPSSLMPLMGIGAGSGELRCTPCEREFTNLPEFQKHITEVHLLTNTSGSPLREGFVTPERPINPAMAQSTRPPYTITPTSSYCEICNKELCNKYFMKTHMQRMHGIEIENGAQIGGVVCNICNKELCSKYFLRVHKHNTHGIIEDGAPLPQPRQNGLNLETALQQQMLETEGLNRNLNMSPFGSGGSEGKNDSYTSSTYTEICPICTRRFRNVKWLRSHLISEHGPSGMDKVRELEQQYGGSLSKPSSPTLKVPNGSSSAGSSNTPTAVPSPAQLAQALQNLNAQHLLQNMPKNNMANAFNNEQNLQSPQLKEYQCSMCPFTTPYYAFLFIHERTHSIINNNEQEPEQEENNEQHFKQEKLEEPLQQSQHQEESTQERMESKSLKRKSSRETPPEIVALDEDDNEELENKLQQEQVSFVTNNEPTNLSMRTPSPTEITSTTSREDMPKPLSPKSQLTQDNSISDSKDYQQTSISPRGFRSAACSPVFSNFQQQFLQEIAQQSGKPASFAVPREDETSTQMQAFVIEAVAQGGGGDDHDDADDVGADVVSNRFVPAIVYLPVKERLTGTMKLSFNLTPV